MAENKDGVAANAVGIMQLLYKMAIIFIAIFIFKVFFYAKLPAWTGNWLDDLLYYAYDYEKFGWLASVWRWYLVAAVLVGTIDVAIYVYRKIKPYIFDEVTKIN